MTRRPHRASWLGLALLLLPACGTFITGPANRCESDADCATGTCDVALQVCIGTPPTTMRIGLEVRPQTEPFGGSVQPVAFDVFTVDGPTVQDLTLPIGIPTTGVVRDTMTGLLLSADIELTLVSPIPGGPATTIVVQASEESRIAEDGYEFNFATQLLPNREYRVTVIPTGDWRALRPPMRFSTRYMSPDYGLARLEFLQYPGACVDPASEAGPCLAELQGSVRGTDGLAQNGMVVKLVDRVSGAAISSRYVTGRDVEQPDGYFHVVFPVESWRNSADWFLHISPSSALVEESGPSPTFTVAPTALLEVEGMVTVLTPDFDALRITYSGIVETSDARPVANAAVQFTANDIVDPTTGVIGAYTTTVFTNADGAFADVPLFGTAEGVDPPNYEIVITPSQTDDALGVLREGRILGSSAAGQLFTVPNRARLNGTVQTVDGLRMTNALVVSRPRGGDRDGTLERVAFFARSSNTVTDPDGLFDLPLDIGLYDIVVEPPMGSGFPWRIDRDVAIGGSGAPRPVYELAHPVPITGVATWGIDGPDGHPIPVANGEIRAYGLVDDGAGVRAVEVGRATTDTNGSYMLLLPPSI